MFHRHRATLGIDMGQERSSCERGEVKRNVQVIGDEGLQSQGFSLGNWGCEIVFLLVKCLCNMGFCLRISIL